jgi:hypothetical protein
MIRIIAKLFAVTVVFTAFSHIESVRAEDPVLFVSATGGGSACTQTAPCASVYEALLALPSGGRIICMTPVFQNINVNFNINGTYVFDCPSITWAGAVDVSGSNIVVKFKHAGFSGLATVTSMVKVAGGGTLIFDDCIFEDIVGTALDIEPTGPLNLVITNSRMSNNAAGALIKPAAGGSVTATFNGVTVDGNSGGGLKADTTNGPVGVDISNSTISNNTGNGLNAVGGAGGPAIFNIHNGVIAKNGTAGVQVNGTTAAAMLDTTLLDSNASGATTVINGGHILTYGNNRIVGSSGSGFTGTASLH